MGRNIGAGVAGIVAALAVIWGIERLGHVFFPPPEGINFADPEALRPWIETLPLGAFLFIGGAWFVGSFVGIVVASRIGTASSTVFALVIGGLVLAATIANLAMIWHPMWFNVVGIVAVLAGSWLGMTVDRAKGSAA